MGLIALLACTDPPEPPRFVRGGIMRGGTFEARAWTPGETVEGVIAPANPECAPVFSVELEDMDRLAAMGAPAPGAALAFAPDGRLAVGSDAGSLRVLSPTGEELVRTQIAEGAVKRVAWSPTGDTLYVGEQSPDADLLALDPDSLETRWSVRMADELETSALPPADDVYGLYSLPGVFSIHVLEGGDILVAAAHGWTDGTRKNRARIYRFAADGSARGAWPPSGPADAVLLHPAVSADRVLVGVSRSADGPPPLDLPIGGVVALNLATLTPAWQSTFAPLEPYFKGVFLWEASGISSTLAFAGLGDGRAVMFGPDGVVTHTLTPGVPVLSQGVPIATGVGFGTVVGDTAYFLTTSTNIPWGSADPMARPPTAHPAQNTVHAVAADGATRWSWQTDHAIQGVVPSPDGASLLLAAAERTSDARTDLYGGLILDRATGKVVTTCPTEGPTYFRPTWASDGRIAVSEAPFLVDGAVRGAYRVTVFR